MNWVTSYGNLQMQYTGTVAMLAQLPTAAEGKREREREKERENETGAARQGKATDSAI